MDASRSGRGYDWTGVRYGLYPGSPRSVFAVALTRVQIAAAGRAYAAYGGVYIVASILWLWMVEGSRPDRWDALGAATCILGAAIIVLGPRGV